MFLIALAHSRNSGKRRHSGRDRVEWQWWDPRDHRRPRTIVVRFRPQDVRRRARSIARSRRDPSEVWTTFVSNRSRTLAKLGRAPAVPCRTTHKTDFVSNRSRKTRASAVTPAEKHRTTLTTTRTLAKLGERRHSGRKTLEHRVRQHQRDFAAAWRHAMRQVNHAGR